MATQRRVLLPLLFAICFVSAAQHQALAQGTSVAELPSETAVPGIQADGLNIPDQKLTLSEEAGWLVAKLVAEQDELEWKIVLAKIDQQVKPVIEVHPQLPFFSVQYGPYFIREGLGRLRVNRERKEFSDDDWKQIGQVPEGESPCGAGRLFVVEHDDWLWACTSPKNDRENIDTLIRFQRKDLDNGRGSMALADGQFAEVFCGEARCHDEGDLLVAVRTTTYAARAMSTVEATRNALAGHAMPELSGEDVGDVEMPSRDQLQGKVILIDFWATWCGPCVKKLPEVSKLQEEYDEQGLVVIGVHSHQNADGLSDFLSDHKLGFPVLLDDGETAARFAVSQLPTYFLIGRDGNVREGFGPSLPTVATIEAELEKSVR